MGLGRTVARLGVLVAAGLLSLASERAPIEHFCNDSQDDDGDGDIDCADVDCVDTLPCQPREDCRAAGDEDFDGREGCDDGNCAALCVPQSYEDATGDQSPAGDPALDVVACDVARARFGGSPWVCCRTAAGWPPAAGLHLWWVRLDLFDGDDRWLGSASFERRAGVESTAADGLAIGDFTIHHAESCALFLYQGEAAAAGFAVETGVQALDGPDPPAIDQVGAPEDPFPILDRESEPPPAAP